MAHSVIIATPKLTWDETVERLGLSKADQRFVASLFEGRSSRKGTVYAFEARSASSLSERNGTKNASGLTRKTKTRARKTA
jgi:hypothetical protein